MTLLIFDVDGTLIDSAARILRALELTFQAFGRPPPSREASFGIVGLSLPEAFRTLVGEEAPIEAMAAHYKGLYGPLSADPALEAMLFPGIADLIDRLGARPDVTLAIATGKSRRGVAQLLNDHGWQGRFAAIRTADDCPSKPHPAMIAECLAETGTPAEGAFMIGDSVHDMRMARAAGVHAVAVGWGFQPVPLLREAGAQTVVATAPDIEALAPLPVAP